MVVEKLSNDINTKAYLKKIGVDGGGIDILSSKMQLHFIHIKGLAVGGANIFLTEEGKSDRLLKGLPSTFRVLLGHKEACDSLPPECVLLATNDACPVQIFKLKNNIYATQFHPEGDSEGFITRILVYKNYGYFPPDTVQQLIEAVEGEQVPEAQSILRRFVRLYRL